MNLHEVVVSEAVEGGMTTKYKGHEQVMGATNSTYLPGVIIGDELGLHDDMEVLADVETSLSKDNYLERVVTQEIFNDVAILDSDYSTSKVYRRVSSPSSSSSVLASSI